MISYKWTGLEHLTIQIGDVKLETEPEHEAIVVWVKMDERWIKIDRIQYTPAKLPGE